MTKHVSDGERFTQITLNRKLKELKQKEKEVDELRKTIETLEYRLRDNENTINILCRQISSLVCNQHIRHA